MSEELKDSMIGMEINELYYFIADLIGIERHKVIGTMKVECRNDKEIQKVLDFKKIISLIRMDTNNEDKRYWRNLKLQWIN